MESPAPELLIKAVRDDHRDEALTLVKEFDPADTELSATDRFEVASYLDDRNIARAIGWEPAEQWYLSARKAGYGVESLCRAGLARERRKNWQGAVELYEAAEKDSEGPLPSEWYGRLGWSAHFTKQRDTSRAAYERMLELAPEPFPSYMRTVLSRSTNKFLQKIQVARFLEDFKDDIDVEYDALTSQQLDPSGNYVFMYWAQGLEQAPPVVRASVAAWRREVGDRLVFLDQTLLSYWVSFDSIISSRLEPASAGFSDFLRAELLARYGGIWADATTFPTPIYKDFISEIEQCPVFAPRYQGAAISSWFIRGSNRSSLLKRLVASLRVYWRNRKRPVGYFMFHYMFECIAIDFPAATDEWAQAPDLSSRSCHRVQSISTSETTLSVFHDHLQMAPVQKMTHKLKEFQPTPDCGLSYLIRWASSPL